MRLIYRLNRGPNGFGIDIDSYNFIVGMQAGGQGHLDGLICPGDSVVAVDGVPLAGAQQQTALRKRTAAAGGVRVMRDWVRTHPFRLLPAFVPPQAPVGWSAGSSRTCTRTISAWSGTPRQWRSC